MTYYALILIGNIYILAVVAQLLACSATARQKSATGGETTDGFDLTPNTLDASRDATLVG